MSINDDPMMSLLTEDEKKLILIEQRIRIKYLALHPELINFHASLGPSALTMTDDEIMESLDEVNTTVMAQKAVWNSKTEAEKLLEYLEETYTILLDIFDECHYNLNEISTWNSSDNFVKSRIHEMIEMPLLCMNRTETFDPRALSAKHRANKYK